MKQKDEIILAKEDVSDEVIKGLFYLSARNNTTPQESIAAALTAALRYRPVIAELLQNPEYKKPAPESVFGK